MSSTVAVVEADLERLRRIGGVKWTKYPAQVMPAWVADMDFDPAPGIKAAIAGMVDAGDLGYNFEHSERVVRAWAEWQERQHGWRPPEHESRTFTGSLHALEATMVLHTSPGDGVAVTTPIYAPFRDAIELSGRRLVDVPLPSPDWRLDAALLDAHLDAGTRVLLLCQPHNPLGRVFDAHELRAVAEVAERRDLLIISDEIWGDLTHDGHRHLPLVAAVPEISHRTITLGSASKTFNLAGLRCSVAHLGPPSIRRAIADFPPHLLGAPSSLGAAGTVAAWTEPGAGEWLASCRAQLQENLDHLVKRVDEDLPGVTTHRPQATYLAWLNFGGTPLADNPSKQLLKTAGVALEPGGKFCPRYRDHARINFATSPEILDEVLDRIAARLSADAS